MACLTFLTHRSASSRRTGTGEIVTVFLAGAPVAAGLRVARPWGFGFLDDGSSLEGQNGGGAGGGGGGRLWGGGGNNGGDQGGCGGSPSGVGPFGGGRLACCDGGGGRGHDASGSGSDSGCGGSKSGSCGGEVGNDRETYEDKRIVITLFIANFDQTSAIKDTLTLFSETKIILCRMFHYNSRIFSCLKLFQQCVPDVIYCKSSVCNNKAMTRGKQDKIEEY